MDEKPLPYGLVARPGDTVVLIYSQALTNQEIDIMRTEWRAYVGEGVKLAFADRCSSALVVRGDAARP